MRNLKIQKPGMRNIKTGIGVMICVLIGYIHIIDNIFFAATACIVCMQTTVKSSLTVGLNRLKGTLVGGLIGFLFVLIRPGSPVLACLGVITTIYVCNVLNIKNSITVASIVYCAIMLNIGTNNPLTYSLGRTWDTSMGVIIGVAVNYYIFRPNYLNSIYKEIRIIETTSIKLLQSEIEKGIHMDRSFLKKEISKLEGLYKNFLEELEYSNQELDDEEINKTIKRCKQIYLHLQILEQMKDKCYLNKENYIKSKSLCEGLAKNLEIKERTSIVYNYHIGAIIKNINEIHETGEHNSINENNEKVAIFV